ncbi:MAG: hypothetical protein ACRDOE_22510, partial [Streptosporangiaceae bacterium]
PGHPRRVLDGPGLDDSQQAIAAALADARADTLEPGQEAAIRRLLTIPLRDLVQSYLERAGFTVLSTGSGAEAISMAAAAPDLVVLALGCRMCR